MLTGSAIGSNLGRRFHVRGNTMMLLVGCGAAGAVASIFKAPIAGLVFVLEVLMLDLNMASLLPLLVTCVTSACVSYAFYGTESMFSFSLDRPFSIEVIPACILLGMVCGLVSLYFTRAMNWFEGIFGGIKSQMYKFLLGASVLGVLIFFFPVLYGEGYDVIAQLLNNDSAANIMPVIAANRVGTETVAPNEANNHQSSALTSAIVSSLTDNFNYIGWACGAIVFFFLWFSMGSIELALISFLPMAVSWVWILGIMSLLDIQFNVVNIILATFIFGQGDDYTIFMTEGCQYEYAYRRKMLNSYKQSIIISALIMFIGIGSLIVARHPALRSLAEVTIVGMFTVVFMAWLLPTYCFRWLVYDRNGNERKQPITLCGLLFRNRNSAYQKVLDRYRYRGVGISTAVNRRLHYLRKHPEELQQLSSTPVFVDNGWGETAMIVAMLNPDRSFVAKMKNEERSVIANNAIDGYMTNLKIETLTE